MPKETQSDRETRLRSVAYAISRGCRTLDVIMRQCGLRDRMRVYSCLDLLRKKGIVISMSGSRYHPAHYSLTRPYDEIEWVRRPLDSSALAEAWPMTAETAQMWLLQAGIPLDFDGEPMPVRARGWIVGERRVSA